MTSHRQKKAGISNPGVVMKQGSWTVCRHQVGTKLVWLTARFDLGD